MENLIIKYKYDGRPAARGGTAPLGGWTIEEDAGSSAEGRKCYNKIGGRDHSKAAAGGREK